MTPTISRNKFDIILLTKIRKEIYLELINQNVSLIKNLEKSRRKLLHKNFIIYSKDYFISRAIYLEIMALLGITYETTVKLVLLKRNFCINFVGKKKNKSNLIKEKDMIKFNVYFLNNLKRYNQSSMIGYEAIKLNDKIYSSAKRFISNYKNNKVQQKFYFSAETYSFGSCINKFILSNPSDYLSFVGSFDYISKEKDKEGYLKKIKKLDRITILEIVRNMRNNYIHLPEPKSEADIVFWYMYNYLICILKQEFPNDFKNKQLLGDKSFRGLFKK